jgi:hypothetical protein
MTTEYFINRQNRLPLYEEIDKIIIKWNHSLKLRHKLGSVFESIPIDIEKDFAFKVHINDNTISIIPDSTNTLSLELVKTTLDKYSGEELKNIYINYLNHQDTIDDNYYIVCLSLSIERVKGVIKNDNGNYFIFIDHDKQLTYYH